MRVIYKYPLKGANIEEILLPKGGKVLDVQLQKTVGICLWALVDPDEPVKERWCIRIWGTGFSFEPDRIEHLGTVQDGLFVWHVFREKI